MKKAKKGAKNSFIRISIATFILTPLSMVILLTLPFYQLNKLSSYLFKVAYKFGITHYFERIR
ncbi:hypothetical protein AFK69_17575 [Xenorhabdus sp. GDc328]|nr:hypothetical protein AAY47_11860 [Xenorhabdus griffiniae]KOP32043.1 hypothetical protein AFK69_17575 [Xenorhabdus sp. GDc328]